MMKSSPHRLPSWQTLAQIHTTTGQCNHIRGQVTTLHKKIIFTHPLLQIARLLEEGNRSAHTISIRNQITNQDLMQDLTSAALHRHLCKKWNHRRTLLPLLGSYVHRLKMQGPSMCQSLPMFSWLAPPHQPGQACQHSHHTSLHATKFSPSVQVPISSSSWLLSHLKWSSEKWTTFYTRRYQSITPCCHQLNLHNVKWDYSIGHSQVCEVCAQ